jgi:hypothetical protein
LFQGEVSSEKRIKGRGERSRGWGPILGDGLGGPGSSRARRRLTKVFAFTRMMTGFLKEARSFHGKIDALMEVIIHLGEKSLDSGGARNEFGRAI